MTLLALNDEGTSMVYETDAARSSSPLNIYDDEKRLNAAKAPMKSGRGRLIDPATCERSCAAAEVKKNRFGSKRMQRIRNPRYAPEMLEKKLYPSAVGLSVPAEVFNLTLATGDDPRGPKEPALPPLPPGPIPPLLPPGYPGGPGEPA